MVFPLQARHRILAALLRDLRRAGSFVFNAVSNTLRVPLLAAEEALAGP